MYLIALKMLERDKTKFFVLLGAIIFATFLMMMQSGIFLGFLDRVGSGFANSKASIWVVDKRMEQYTDILPVRDIELNRVRSVHGVSWATPLFQGVQSVLLSDGTFKKSYLIGVDAATLIGMPTKIISGSIQDLNKENSIIIDDLALQKLVTLDGKHLSVGDSLRINSQEAKIVAIVESVHNVYNIPTIYTTFNRAIEYSPPTNNHTSFILAEPIENEPAEKVAKQIEAETGLQAMTSNQFYWKTVWWFIYNTGIVLAFGTATVLGFIIGGVVSIQVFYLFILENLHYFGALKAMGATNSLIGRMLFFQNIVVGLLGFGIGVIILVLFALVTLHYGDPPFFIPLQVIILTFSLIIFICLLATGIGLRKIVNTEVAEVFRG